MQRMRFVSYLLGISLAVLSNGSLAQESSATASAPLTVFLVRHGEKLTSGKDPELSQAGHSRAQQLARVLADTKLDKVYSTDFFRTRQTAKPVAEYYKQDIELYDYKKLRQLAEELKEAGGRYLIVGHSNTTPSMVKLLGGEPGNPIEEKSEFDRLYIINVSTSGEVNSLLLRYGKPY